MIERLTIGSRGSKLALWQTNWVRDRLTDLFPELVIDIEVISTKGDRILDQSLPSLGAQGKGLFTKELEDALLESRIDLAVHSLKDLPTDTTQGLQLTAICEREDVRDALLTREPVSSFRALPAGAVIGTSSLRRQAQLKAVRPDFITEPIRGNVDTRLRKLDQGQFHAIVLAAAGLTRLGFSDRITQYLETSEMLPAPGQGALAVETRSYDNAVNDLVSKLDHQETRLACECERAFLRGLGGGCLVPIAAHAEFQGSKLSLRGLVASANGSRVVEGNRTGDSGSASETGLALAEDLLRSGAADLLREG